MVHITRLYSAVLCFVSILYHNKMYNIIIVLYKQNILVVVVVDTFSGKNGNLIVLFQPH